MHAAIVIGRQQGEKMEVTVKIGNYEYLFVGTITGAVDEADYMAWSATYPTVKLLEQDGKLLYEVNRNDRTFHDEEFRRQYEDERATLGDSKLWPVEYPLTTVVNAWYWSDFTPPRRQLAGEIVEREAGEPVAIVVTDGLLAKPNPDRVLVKGQHGYTWLQITEVTYA